MPPLYVWLNDAVDSSELRARIGSARHFASNRVRLWPPSTSAQQILLPRLRSCESICPGYFSAYSRRVVRISPRFSSVLYLTLAAPFQWPLSSLLAPGFVRRWRTAKGRVRERASGIGAEIPLTAALGIAVARGWMSTAGYVPDAVFR